MSNQSTNRVNGPLQYKVMRQQVEDSMRIQQERRERESTEGKKL